MTARTVHAQKDRRVIMKNRQLEIIKDIHEGKAIITLTTIPYQVFIICFNPILLESKQNP